MSKYKFGIMHLPIKTYLKWWLEKYAQSKEVDYNKTFYLGKTEQFSTTGRNLLPIIEAKTETVAGELTLISYGNGTYRAYGTTTARRSIYWNLPEQINLPRTTIYVHMRNNAINSSVNLGFKDASNNGSLPGFTTLNRIMTSSGLTNLALVRLGIEVAENETLDITFTPSLELTNEVTDYEPYTRSDFQVLLQVIHGLLLIL